MKTIRSILIIHPDKSLRGLSKELKHEGFKSVIASTRSDVFTQLLKHTPDVILFNHNTPDKMGLSPLKEIIHSRPQAPVIVAAERLDGLLALKCMRLGALDYLLKPVTIGALFESIQRIQDRQQSLFTVTGIDSECVVREDKIITFGNDIESIPSIINQAVLNAGKICEDVDMLKMALGEIVLNAIEHGNLNISMEEKSEAVKEGTLEGLINKRRKIPKYANRSVVLKVYMDHNTLEYHITDEGDGFDYIKAFDSDPNTHIGSGLGVQIARNFFNEVVYEGPGNKVRLVYSKKGDPSQMHKPLTLIGDVTEIIRQKEEMERLLMESSETKDLMEEQAARLTITLAEMDEKNEIIKAQNQRMIEELKMAARLQKSLLPDTFENLNGVSFSCKYIPSIHIGGDLYDVVNLGQGQAGFIIADVSGHGVAAALISSMFKMSFHALASTVASPKILMHMLNNELRPVLNEDYITAFFVLTDRYAKTVTYSNAGHPSPLLFKRSTKEIIELDTDGFFLGSFDDGGYDEKAETNIEQGDALLMYTDCILETSDEHGRQYGKERLIQCFQNAVSKLRGKEVIEAIEADMRSFNSHGALDDDFTVMLLEFWEEASAQEVLSDKEDARGGFVEF